jgi:hypothetical protein
MSQFAQFFDMMKNWNDGLGVKEAMTFRLRDAIRNTRHESGALYRFAFKVRLIGHRSTLSPIGGEGQGEGRRVYPLVPLLKFMSF